MNNVSKDNNDDDGIIKQAEFQNTVCFCVNILGYLKRKNLQGTWAMSSFTLDKHTETQ